MLATMARSKSLLARCCQLAMLVIFLGQCAAHNWNNMPGRAKKISTMKPCESRESLQQAHLQANPGDEFPVEWATGHEGSTGNWVLVRAEDEMKLVQWSFGLGDKYISGAPSSEKYQTYHVTGVKGSKIDRLATSSSCGVKGKPVFSKEVDKATAHNRPSSFVPIAMDKVAKGTEGVHGSAHLNLETPGAMKFFQYSDDMKDMCKNSIWAGYNNEQYPWIVAASKYQVAVGQANGGGITLFKIPEDTPPGKYVLHWYWRNYVNCHDVNVVVSSKKVTDVWGVPDPGKSGKLVVTKIDHCQTWRQGYMSSSPDDVADKDAKPMTTSAGALNNYNRKLADLKDAYAKYDAQQAKVTAAQRKMKPAYDDWQATKKAKGQRNPVTRAKLATYNDLKKPYDAERSELQKLSKIVKDSSKGLFMKSFMPTFGQRNLADWGTWHHKCTVVPKEELHNAAQICSKVCQPPMGNGAVRGWSHGFKCNTVNIVPIKRPASSPFAGAVNKMIPDQCRDMADAAPDGAYMCYQLIEPPPTNGGPAMTITKDPDDPAWYSTCLKFKKSQARIFTGNTCGNDCLLTDANVQDARWRFGNKCISCNDMNKNDQGVGSLTYLPAQPKWFVPEWVLSDTCEDCSEPSSVPTPKPSPPTPPPTLPPAQGEFSCVLKLGKPADYSWLCDHATVQSECTGQVAAATPYCDWRRPPSTVPTDSPITAPPTTPPPTTPTPPNTPSAAPTVRHIAHQGGSASRVGASWSTAVAAALAIGAVLLW